MGVLFRVGGAPVTVPAVAADADGAAPPLIVLAAGVDSVYACVRDGLDPDRLAEAICHRAAASDADDSAVCTIGSTGRTLLAKPHGYRKHVTWYTCPDLDVMVGADPHRPALLLQLRSAFIHSVGVEAAVADAERVAAHFCAHVVTPETRRPAGVGRRWGIRSERLPGTSLMVSRIDLYADTQGWQPSIDDLERFVTRARRRRAWPRRTASASATESGFSPSTLSSRITPRRNWNSTRHTGLSGSMSCQIADGQVVPLARSSRVLS
jgi:hypothetical protein